MQTVTIVAQPEAEESWLHRFRNFGEEVYVQLRDRYAVSIEEIDAAVDTFHVRDIPDAEAETVAATVRRILGDHHLDDSVITLSHHRERSGPTVVLVVDPDFGERLWQIAASHERWVVPSDVNRSVVEQMWKKRAEPNDGPSLTIWSDPMPAVTAEDWLAILDTIEVHHGSFWCEPPLDILSVYGAAPTANATAALDEYDYDLVQGAKSGFIAMKRHAA